MGTLRRKFSKLVRYQQEKGWSSTFTVILLRLLTPILPGTSYHIWHIWRDFDAYIQQRESPPKGHLRFLLLLNVDAGSTRSLRQTLCSIAQQTYPHWQLLLVGSCALEIPSTLRGDRRLLRSTGALAEINQQLAASTADYLILLEGDGQLNPQALADYNITLEERQFPSLLYSDEDSCNRWRWHFQPEFKPVWSPDYFLSHNYLGPLCCFQRALVQASGGLLHLPGLAARYDLTLRLLQAGSPPSHLARVLWHRHGDNRQTPPPEAGMADAAEAAGVLQQSLADSGQPCTIEPLSPAGYFRLHRPLPEQPLVSLLIPSGGKVIQIGDRSLCLVENCLASVLTRSSYRRFEIILVDGYDLDPGLLERLEDQMSCYPELTWHLVRDSQPFNFSRRINLAAAKARGDFNLLLNDDTEVLSPDWMEAMLTYGMQPGVGAVGAKLLYPDGQLQHCGVSVNDWGPYHCYAEAPDQWTPTNNHPLAVRNFIAVTGACLMMQHQRFKDLGRLDEALPLNYNDIDLCMRAYYAGDRNVYTPFARLLHYETASRPKGVQPEELSYFREKWQSRLPDVEADPYFSAWSQALYAPKVMPPLDSPALV